MMAATGAALAAALALTLFKQKPPPECEESVDYDLDQLASSLPL